MENRIEINGVWYVREDSTKPQEAKQEFNFEVLESRELQIETNKYLLVGSVLIVNDGECSMPSLQIVFKEEARETEFWDRESFLVGLATGDDEAMEQMVGESQEFLAASRLLTQEMLERGWIWER